MYTVEEFDKEKTKVLKYVLYKKRSENEIRKKFEKEIEENLLEDIIAYLKEAKYIDDKEYIRKTINNFMALKNLSIREIEYKLLQKGVSRELIDNYIEQNREKLAEHEITSAKLLYEKKLANSLPEEAKRHLLRKGYREDVINDLLE